MDGEGYLRNSTMYSAQTSPDASASIARGARLVLILFMSLHDALECKTNSITRYESRVCIGASAHRRPPLHTKQKAIDVTVHPDWTIDM